MGGTSTVLIGTEQGVKLGLPGPWVIVILSGTMSKNAAAVALGKLNQGRKKTLSAAERERRRRALEAVRAKRWQTKA